MLTIMFNAIPHYQPNMSPHAAPWYYLQMYLYLYLENGCNLQTFNKLNNLSFLTTGFGQQFAIGCDLLAHINEWSIYVEISQTINQKTINLWFEKH